MRDDNVINLTYSNNNEVVNLTTLNNNFTSWAKGTLPSNRYKSFLEKIRNGVSRTNASIVANQISDINQFDRNDRNDPYFINHQNRLMRMENRNKTISNMNRAYYIGVICSQPGGRNYERGKDIIKNKMNLPPRAKFEFIDRQEPIGKTFPNNVPTGREYDLLWFAGCNLAAVFLNRRTGNYLKPNGKIIFTESQGFVTKHQVPPSTFPFVSVDAYYRVANKMPSKNEDKRRVDNFKRNFKKTQTANKVFYTFKKRRR